ncbi:FAD dependent oxidoreductase family protein [Dendrothele bispora CBS 962.96]|uniref:FAD dependent oxidoreductase family protein n=1 Tax=Dendrothele bispora (strain CBS 962.96) TaxID=1314807 RepID=A0A4S8M5S1_DENBC|nr:FAD dependent oxidoreductase family protein [Dendrothele bispora CBS 962.96]
MLDYNPSLDVLIVGSGFAGIYQLYQLRKLGYSVHIFDSAGDTGGTWYWNCYPGARTDSAVPIYGFSIPEIWEDWTWTERFPGWKELRRYFDHVDKKLDVKKDISFDTRVVSAHWDSNSDRWIVTAENGRVARPRFLVICTGFASIPYVPNLKGLDSFEGICHHTARWPQEDVDMKDKRVGVIGTGATGVQVIQEIGKDVKHLAVFQRTPNLAIAMEQRKLSAEKHDKMKKDGLYSAIFQRRLQTATGHDRELYPKSFLDTTPEERRLHWEEAWAQGGVAFLITNYLDAGTKDEAIAEVYDFWRQKVHARVTDPVKAELLAPKIAPHPLAAKRASLEQTYYEVFNQPNVTLTDVSKYPIEEINPKGVRTADGVFHELDILVLATGFDITAGVTQMDIRGVDGTSVKEKWAEGVYSNLGMTIANFPNLFYAYGPQAPTAFSNGPTCIEIQCDWITKCIKYMMDNNLARIEPEIEAEKYWHQQIWETSKYGPWMKARGWYNNSNIPGKPFEPLNYAGGVATYAAYIEEKARKGYEGFIFSTRSATGQINRMDRKVEIEQKRH